jgi:hypothetical protein
LSFSSPMSFSPAFSFRNKNNNNNDNNNIIIWVYLITL